MSITAEAIAPCSKCGTQHKITIYRSINTAENPEIKEKLKDGSLFVWECPECHQKNLAKYESLYHDPEKRIMIWLLPSGDLPESQMNAIKNHTEAMGNYTLRRVSDTGSLMEKILIFDAGLDDAIIEMCKYVTKTELAGKAATPSQSEEIKNAAFHFFRMEGDGDNRFITFIYPADNRMQSVNIGYNVYEDCAGILQRNPDIIPTGPFPAIDSGWIYSIMK